MVGSAPHTFSKRSSLLCSFVISTAITTNLIFEKSDAVEEIKGLGRRELDLFLFSGDLKFYLYRLSTFQDWRKKLLN